MAIGKNDTLPFRTAQTKLEIRILTEKQQAWDDKLHETPFIGQI